MAVKAYPLEEQYYDVLVIGAGGAGLRAALAAVEGGARVAVVSKVPTLCSHTGAAQGGINAALGNHSKDDWRWHAYDTVRGSDWLGDQDAIAYMCNKAPEAILELEHMGMLFSRDAKGQIYQRAYGGQSTEYGKGGLAYRACAVADRTGHALLYTLQGQALKAGVEIWEECIALDLLMAEGSCLGAIVWKLESGELFTLRAKTTIIATGGGGQMYLSTTTASACTGDGGAMVLRAGLPLQDMEFTQFHPTSLYSTGILVSEAARAEGGMLFNVAGERFMERYAPKYKDLASRDVISRAIVREIREGRGCGPKRDYIELRLQHLPEDVLRERIPSAAAVARTFSHLDIRRDAIPILPAAHFIMGGIPTDRQSRVFANEVPVPGLMAIGEASCTSVHGANRLGCNSLLELVVFGKSAGELAARVSEGHRALPAASVEKILNRFDVIRHKKGGIQVSALRRSMREVMHHHAAIFRTDDVLKAGMRKMQEISQIRHDSLGISDKSLIWNTELAAALELDNLLAQSFVALASAAYRTESRGAHFRDDYPERNDADWLAHTTAYLEADETVRTEKRAVHLFTDSPDMTTVKPETRGY